MNDQPLSDGERAELERLRAQRADPDRARPRGRAWWALSVTALVLAALVGMLSVPVVFARGELLDTDRYVQTVEPLAENDEIRAAVAARITDTLNEHLAVREFIAEAVDSIQTVGAGDVLDSLTGPMTSAVEGFVADQVIAIVYSERFSRLWTTVNETAHREIVEVLHGTATDLLAVRNDVLYLDLSPVIEQVRILLIDRGLTIAERLPEISAQFPLMEVQGLTSARGLATLLNTLAWTMPLAALALFAVGVYIAPNHRRALLVGAVSVAVAMVVLLIGIAVGRAVMLADLPRTVRSPDAMAAAYDIVVRFLISTAQTTMVLALLVAAVAWLFGPGAVATGVRGGLARLRDLTAGGLSRTNLPLGATARFAADNRRALEVAALGLGAVWLVLWSHRGIDGTLWIAAAVAAAVGAVEVLGRVPPTVSGPAPDSSRAA